MVTAGAGDPGSEDRDLKTGGCDFTSYVTSPQPLTLIFRYVFGKVTKPNSEALMSAQKTNDTGSQKPVSLPFKNLTNK